MDEGVFREAVENLGSDNPEVVRTALRILETLLKKRFDDLIQQKESTSPLDESALETLERGLGPLQDSEFNDSLRIVKGLSEEIRSLIRAERSTHSSPELPLPSLRDSTKPGATAEEAKIETLEDFVTSLGDELRALGVFDKRPSEPCRPGSYASRSGEVTKPAPEPLRPEVRLQTDNTADSPLATALKAAALRELKRYCNHGAASSPEDGRRYSLHPPEPITDVARQPKERVPKKAGCDAGRERPDVEIVEISEMKPLRDLSDEERNAVAREAGAEVERVFRKIMSRRHPEEKRKTRLRMPR